MGRRREPVTPVDVAFVREAFEVRDGVVVWRSRPDSHFPCRRDDATRFAALRAGSSAGFKGPGGKPLVRFMVNGRTRRVSLLRIAWVVATGELPHGVVRARDGNEWNASFDNLIVTKHGRDPFSGVISGKHSRGGKASAMRFHRSAGRCGLKD